MAVPRKLEYFFVASDIDCATHHGTTQYHHPARRGGESRGSHNSWKYLSTRNCGGVQRHCVNGRKKAAEKSERADGVSVMDGARMGGAFILYNDYAVDVVCTFIFALYAKEIVKKRVVAPNAHCDRGAASATHKNHRGLLSSTFCTLHINTQFIEYWISMSGLWQSGFETRKREHQ